MANLHCVYVADNRIVTAEATSSTLSSRMAERCSAWIGSCAVFLICDPRLSNHISSTSTKVYMYMLSLSLKLVESGLDATSDC